MGKQMVLFDIDGTLMYYKPGVEAMEYALEKATGRHISYKTAVGDRGQ
jgi:phosphoglycolate phosphatase-like HAD superfamily hydrolase